MKKLRIITIAVVAIIALAVGLFWKFGEQDNSKEVSDGTLKIISAMVTCPNSDLFNLDAVTNIGMGTSVSSADKEKTLAAAEKVNDNWKKTVGAYFAENSLKTFLTSGVANKYLAEAEQNNTTIALKSTELVERSGEFETVKVVMDVSGADQIAELVFQHDEHDLITIVTIR